MALFNSKVRTSFIAFLGLFALSYSPTLAWATPAIATSRGAAASNKRISTTSQQRKVPFLNSPLFASSTGAASADTNSNKINGAVVSDEGNNKLMEKLRQVSNIASLLCVLDCTLLPIITVILPLLGVLNLGPSQMEFLHVLGHKLALYFVLPVGGLTGLINYLSHKKSWIASMTILGLILVGLANSHIHHLPLLGHVEFLHLIQHGPLHRVTNIVGCGFLLGSNYLSQQQGCAFHDHSADDNCDHSHDHSHSHDYSH